MYADVCKVEAHTYIHSLMKYTSSVKHKAVWVVFRIGYACDPHCERREISL